jgi:PAS domain S-box-containing protein
MPPNPTYEQLRKKIIDLERSKSELSKAVQALNDSERRYKKIFDNLQDVYYETSLDGTILEISPSVERFSLYKRDELLGRSLYDFYADRKDRDQFIEIIVNEGAVTDYEIDLKDKDNSLRPFCVSTRLVRSADGSPEKLIGSLRDISGRKQTEVSLRQVEEWAETILQTIQSGVFVIEAKSHIIKDVNRAAEEMIGANRDEIIGNVCHKFVCPNAAGECPITDEGRAIDDTETILIRKDGGQTRILKTVNHITINEIEYLIESFVDISALRKAEEDAQAHQERFKIFFSSVNDAIFVHPLQSEGFSPFIEVNDIACKRYGYTREEFLELTASDITKKTDADAHAAHSHRKKLLNTKRLIFETVHIKKTGEEFPVEINSNIVTQYGKPVVLAVVRDISERKKAENEKSNIEEQYRQSQKVEAIGRLAGGVAHDLNNILSPIIGYGELLIYDINPEDRRRESVVQIVQAGYRARDLVRQLLAFGRKQTLEYRTIDLNKTIEDFESLLRRTIRENIEIDISPTPNIPAIKADSGQIEQVIMNLCVNAQDAMPDGGKLTLSTSVVEIDERAALKKLGTAAGSYVLLSISDTGYGIDKEIQNKIFEPFFSTKGEQGTGLGLSTVYGIVKQHSGNIWVDSEPKKGSTFRVYLPVSEESVIDKKVSGKNPAKLGGGETILLVEDNEQVLTLSDTILKKLGYTTIVARNGAEALKTVGEQEGKVDLILTDVVMPDMNGRDLYEIVTKKYPEIDVLYMSGYTDNVIAQHGVLEKGVQFIQKPFSVEALSMKVRKVLDASKGAIK